MWNVCWKPIINNKTCQINENKTKDPKKSDEISILFGFWSTKKPQYQQCWVAPPRRWGYPLHLLQLPWMWMDFMSMESARYLDMQISVISTKVNIVYNIVYIVYNILSWIMNIVYNIIYCCRRSHMNMTPSLYFWMCSLAFKDKKAQSRRQCINTIQ